MAFFKIGTTDLSGYISALKINELDNYVSQTNAAGDTKVDYINTKREIEVTFIPLDDNSIESILSIIGFSNTVSYLNPKTGTLATGISCICDTREIEYYTIQTNKTRFKEMKLSFIEL